MQRSWKFGCVCCPDNPRWQLMQVPSNEKLDVICFSVGEHAPNPAATTRTLRNLTKDVPIVVYLERRLIGVALGTEVRRERAAVAAGLRVATRFMAGVVVVADDRVLVEV